MCRSLRTQCLLGLTEAPRTLQSAGTYARQEKAKLKDTIRDADTPSVDYRKQGDVAFYTGDALKTRNALQENRHIHKRIDRLWTTAVGKSRQAMIQKVYVDLNVKICKALFFPDEFTVEDATEAVLEDWANSETDAQGNRPLHLASHALVALHLLRLPPATCKPAGVPCRRPVARSEALEPA